MDNFIKIKDISDKYDITARTLRYYEDMGLINSFAGPYSAQMKDLNYGKVRYFVPIKLK
jgi:hypothetical protein